MLGKLMETLVRVGTAEKGEHAPSPSSLCIKLETKGLYGWPYDYESMGLAALGSQRQPGGRGLVWGLCGVSGRVLLGTKVLLGR
jgi:hypothetical protein